VHLELRGNKLLSSTGALSLYMGNPAALQMKIPHGQIMYRRHQENRLQDCIERGKGPRQLNTALASLQTKCSSGNPGQTEQWL
jgi:hypothetical protein